MSRGALVRLILVLGVLAGCAWLAVEKEPKLGIDLRGGSQLQYEVQNPSDPDATVPASDVDKTIEVLRRRIDGLGVTEPTIARVGDDRILVELPDVQDLEEAKDVLGTAAQLSAHLVLKDNLGANAQPSAAGNQVLPDSTGGGFLELAPTALTGDQIDEANPQQPQNATQWVVAVDFDGSGQDAWEKLTDTAGCAEESTNRVAFVLDGQVISAPTVGPEFCGTGITGGSTQIEFFTESEAKDLSTLIEGGALPLAIGSVDDDSGDFQNGVPLSERVIGPTLGDEAIDASWKAGVIGLLLTALFILLVYRFVGLLAALALSSYALLAYAMLLIVGATLTLPGLAGFVLAIGLAIDANVLVFERAREEYADNRGGGLRRALQIGFNKAWTAIIDSNVTTLLAAALLFILASGPVKGFGVTLSIGVIASMVSALIIARVLTEIGVSSKFVRKRPPISGLAHLGRVREWLNRTNPDLMKRKLTWLGVSAAALIFALVGIAGGMNLGLEFTGGRLIDYSTAQDIDVDDAREAIADAGFPEAVVQQTDLGDISVRTGEISDDEADEIRAALESVAGETEVVNSDKVEPTLGEELRNKALLAFGIALIAQMVYLAIRFKWTFGLAAVIAMFHDVIIVTGVFAWLDKPIDGIFLAAALTIIGLSVNDTVVVFDRIRERWFATTSGTFSEVSNKAAVETMPRTVNTGLGAMFILAALAVLGGDSLQDFAIALLLGLLIGTYSSVFTATPLLIYFQERWPLGREKKERVVRDPEDSGAVI